MDRQACIALIRAHIKDGHLIRHCLATGAVMKHAARHLHEDEERWERIGILHDIDFEEINGDMQRHGITGAEILMKGGSIRQKRRSSGGIITSCTRALTRNRSTLFFRQQTAYRGS